MVWLKNEWHRVYKQEDSDWLFCPFHDVFLKMNVLLLSFETFAWIFSSHQKGKSFCKSSSVLNNCFQSVKRVFKKHPPYLGKDLIAEAIVWLHVQFKKGNRTPCRSHSILQIYKCGNLCVHSSRCKDSHASTCNLNLHQIPEQNLPFGTNGMSDRHLCVCVCVCVCACDLCLHQ